MKLGSLFDGSGGFPLAGALCGIEPAWASEVEPYPIAVTRSRFPNMKHLGDVSKINGAEIEPVDVVTFGFPCQSISVAGKREGIKHKDKGDEETTRSGLFWEAVRIIKEMRGATNGEYPRYAVFENVPGLFSAENGEAFRTVLEGLIQIVEPYAVMPEVPKKGWAYADCFSGDGFSLAYRVFDAQYIRTAQRRRRVYACLDLRGQCAREVLFEREGLRGYFEAGRTPWQGTPADAEGSVAADDREGESNPHIVCAGGFKELNSAKARSDGFAVEIAPTLSANKHDASVAIGIDGYNAALTGDKSAPSVSTGRNGVIEPKTYDARGNGDGKTASTITGDHENRITDYTSVVVEHVVPIHDQATRFTGKRGDKSDGKGNGIGVGNPGDPMNTLTGGDRHAVVYVIDHAITTGGNCTEQNPCVYEDVQATLKAGGVHGVVYALDRASFNQGENAQYDFEITDSGVNSTIVAKGPSAVCYKNTYQKTTGPLMANTHPGSYSGQDAYQDMFVVGETPPPPRYIVRRLTPTECARLQGFPDTWGHIEPKADFTDEEYEFWLDVRHTREVVIDGKDPKDLKDYTKKQMLTWYNKLWTDSAEYKLWGNGIALPCALYVMQGIAERI